MSNKIKRLSRCLTIVFFLTSLVPLSLYAQGKNVTLHSKGITLMELASAIEEQTNYLFLYNDKVDLGTKVNADFEGVSVNDALASALEGTEITFAISGSNITLTPKSNKKSPQEESVVVEGVVRDGDGLPVIGASIIISGTSTGVVTDIDGHYSIEVPANTRNIILEFSCLGYESQKVTWSGAKRVDVILSEDTINLEGTVVTALGIKRSEKALSYNVQQLDGESLTSVKDANFVNSLNGKVAGVIINRSSTGVGGATRVVMRGAKSIEGDNNALYVIDGIPIFNTTQGNQDSGVLGEGRASTEGISDFNPEDIESISILSGPSAAALYGANAANGVVLITTKKGQEGKLQLSFSSSTEFSKPYMTPEFQNTYGNRDGSFESWGDKLQTPSSYDPGTNFFQTGANYINSLTLTTGTKHNQTFASISSTNSKGIVPNNSYNRYNFSVRNTSTFLKDRVQLDLGASYVRQDDTNMVSQGRYWNPIVAAYLFPRGESFESIRTFERYDTDRNIPTQYWPFSDDYATQNPYWTAYRNLAKDTKNRYMFNAGMTFKITDWMNLSARYRFDDTYIKFERMLYGSSYSVFTEGSKKGLYEYQDYQDRQQYADAMLNINKRWDDFSITANIGWSYSDYWNLSRGYKGPLLGVANLFSVSNIDPSNGHTSEDGGDSCVRNHAVFASIEAGWRGLYLTLTGRCDWNSRLVNTAEESVFYPSVGLSFVPTEMFELPDAISYLKIRGSYTEVGAPVSSSGLTPGTVTTPISGGTLQPTGIYPFTDFKAERTRSYEFGLNFKFWHRLSGNLTWYKSNTYNQTFLGTLPESSGYKSIYLQAGDVLNRGWEASLGYDDEWNGFGFSTSFTFSNNHNEILKMVDNYVTAMSPEPISIPEVIKDGGRTILKVGGSISDIYADRFFKKDSQGYVEIKPDGSKSMADTEPVFLGRTTPDFNLGWNTRLSYKGFALGILFNGRFGGVVTSSTQAILDRYGVSKASAIARDAGGVELPGQGLLDAKEYYSMTATGEYHTSGYYCYDATNIRIQELTFSYRFPNKWFKDVLKDLTLSFIANNPCMLYCKAPFDPELTPSTGTYGQGNDYFMQPSVRSFGFNVKFKF